jgi:hypothetical protein
MFGPLSSRSRSLVAVGLLTLMAPLALACDATAILSAAVGTPAPGPVAVSGPTATTASPINIVTNAVTAKDVSGDNVDPVGISDSFPAETSIFHVVVTISNAPENTSVKVNWLTASNAAMGDFTLAAGGTRNLDFSFKPDAGKLPPGGYQAQIYVNDNLDRTLKFTVLPAASATSPAPVSPRPSGIIASVTMATDSKSDTKDPINPTVVFGTTSVFHAIAALQNAPANTQFTATWYVVDVGNAAPPDSQIESTNITTNGTRNIDFTLTPTTSWPAGTYRVEISVNGAVDTVKTFSVK